MFGRNVLLICMLMAAIFTSAVVHAREVPNLPTLECSGEVHTDGESDQSRGDTDKGVPHHHSCHGTAVFVPAASDSPDARAVVVAELASFRSAPPSRWSAGPGLRPPIA